MRFPIRILTARFLPHHAVRVMACCAAAVSVLLTMSTARAQVNVTTYHNDNSRTGQNLSEQILTPANVNPYQFGKLYSRAVDGYVYAQPLYLSGVSIPNKGVHNVVYVATQHDSVYAFDADDTSMNAAPLWHRSFIHPNSGVTTVPSDDVGSSDIVPEIGITGTPVIDKKSGTLYLVAKTKQTDKAGNVTYVQRLHALDVTTGKERTGSPVVIKGSVPGIGDGSVNGVIAFNAFRQNQRPALLLSNGVVYIGWASHGDNVGPQAPDGSFPQGYHGWIMAYDAVSLRQVGIFNTTPNGKTDPSGYPLAAGGVWMGGGGIAADSQGNLYFETGNGAFDYTMGNFGDSFLKLSTYNGLMQNNYFTPFNQQILDDTDEDLGSSGLVILPNSTDFPGHPHLLVGSGKQGSIYIIDRDSLGQFNSGFDAVVQELPSAIGGVWGAPALFRGKFYFGGSYDAIRAFAFRKLHSVNQNFTGGFSTGSNLALNGSAIINGTRVRLTDGNNYESSSVFSNGLVNVATFQTQFQFQIQNGTNPSADGMTFTLQTGSPGALGGNGGGLGYAGIGGSIAVKFDLYNNSGEGTDSTGLYTNGAYPDVPAIDLTNSGIDLHSGDLFQVNMSYDGTTLNVTIKDTKTGATASQSYTIDIPGTIGSSLAYAGFTGGTGGLTAIQDILNWTYTAPPATVSRYVQVAQSPTFFAFPGPTPAISANGGKNGILWAIDTGAYGFGGSSVLHAYDAETLAELYNSDMSGNRDVPAGAVKFTVPTVANGKVFVGGAYGLTVYGELPH